MTTKEALEKSYAKYKLSPLDAGILLSLAVKKPKEYILAHPEKELTALQTKRFISFAKRKSAGEPIAYITGKKEFFGLDFLVNRNVLIPRPETELLVEKTIDKIKKYSVETHCMRLRTERDGFNPSLRHDDKLTIIDVGTGSGNIIISIAKNLPSKIKNKINFYAVDISKKSLRAAKENAKRYKLNKKIKFFQSDLLEYFLKNKIKFENVIIIANLPYLDKKWKNLLDSSESESLKFEPKIALEGGCDGLDVYRKLANHIRRLKAQNERIKLVLFCEIGHIQKNGMKNIFSFSQKIKFYKDLSGKWRAVEIDITR